MKPRLLGLLAGVGSLGFAWWLLAQPHTSRELFLCMLAWVLGFWVASGLRDRTREESDAAEDEEE